MALIALTKWGLLVEKLLVFVYRVYREFPFPGDMDVAVDIPGDPYTL